MTDRKEQIDIILLAPINRKTGGGGIGSWASRVMNSKHFDSSFHLCIVDESVSQKRQKTGKKRLFDEIKRTTRIWKSLRASIDDNNVTLVHSNIPSQTASMLRELGCAIIAKRRECKFIVHFHCTVPYMTNTYTSKKVLAMLLRMTDGVITLNYPSYKYISEKYYKTIEKIPNFIAQQEFLSTQRLRSVNEIKTCLFVGYVIPEKGCWDLFCVAKHFPLIEFRFAGEIPQAIDTILTDNIVLLGPLGREDLLKEYSKADVFMFLTRYEEGFSLALTEAMAASLPCIVTNCEANAAMIEPGGGFVVEVGDIKTVCDDLRKLNDSNFRRKLGEHNRNKAEKEYSEEIVIKQYERFYKTVLKER